MRIASGEGNNAENPSAKGIEQVKAYLISLQDSLCSTFERVDGQGKFKSEKWQQNNGGGGGITRILEKGKVIEKGGINFSHVWGDHLPVSATQVRRDLAHQPFQAMGISLVLHPDNPFVPTVHMNLRFFQLGHVPKASWWFGGGMDLTPCYGFSEDCIHWHKTLKQACSPFGEEVYPRFKKWCDTYFYLKHRQEPRGIGGIFFDDLNEWGFDRCFAFVQRVGDQFMPAYLPILERRCRTPFGEQHKQFQWVRRGRYVEFNLVYDRGTLFGLQSGGRTESILMSLPPRVEWHYDWRPLRNSPEAMLHEHFLKVREWV